MNGLHRGTALAALLTGLGGTAGAQDLYTIGISNTVQGNG